jgi:hypothetical protein
MAMIWDDTGKETPEPGERETDSDLPAESPPDQEPAGDSN